VFTKRDRTARLLGVANLLFQHPNGLTAPHIAALIGMNVRTVYRDLRAIESEVGVPIWQDGSLLMTLDVGGLLEITHGS
jgi:predicted DNA-binding transcriptional regulator YafY